MQPLGFTDLGRTSYADAYARQVEWCERIVASRDSRSPIPGHVMLVEHDPPVITVTPRKDAPAHVIASPAQLVAAGVSVVPTDRGGDVTYHGPGQLVAYPIIDLNAHHLRLHEYMRLLESVVMSTCSAFAVRTMRDPKATGVWTMDPHGEPGAKIAAMGVRVRRWVSLHGLALNVTTNLDHFALIVPCGLVGRAVTSLQNELGPRCPTMAAVKACLRAELARALAACRPESPQPVPPPRSGSPGQPSPSAGPEA